jgi:tetratricopeptide (TPR) repeat protein
MPKLVAMLRAWGEGKRTPDVIRTALGIAPDELDKQFRDWLNLRLSRYAKQYMPDFRATDPEKADKEAKADPKNLEKQIRLAVSQIAVRDVDAAEAALSAAAAIDPKSPDVRFLRERIFAGTKKPDEAKKELEAMIAEGHDGYGVRMLLADMYEGDDKKRSETELEAASNLDPTQAEPLQALVDGAKKAGNEDRELEFLRKLAMVDQHDRRVWRRLLAKLVARGLWDEAEKIGEGALYVDIHGADTHTLYAEALLHTKKVDKAIFEADSALLCEPLKVEAAARANVVLAQAWLSKGDKEKARAARDEALRQDPESKAAKEIQGL